jgi:hypothetical protein
LDTIFQSVVYDGLDTTYTGGEEGVRALLELQVGAIEVISFVIYINI